MAELESHCEDPVILNTRPDYVRERSNFVDCVARLNSVANVRRKGRDDMTDAVLVQATAVMQEHMAKGSDSTSEVARILASDVVESFEAMRDYVRQVGECLECVDPNLCKNAGLVARLADWEESWEVGSQYVQKRDLLESVCNLVTQVQSAQRLVPALTAMCEDCDVELFLVLPRIIWLCYLAAPAKHQPLLASLLPNRFATQDAELSSFVEMFQRVNASTGGSGTLASNVLLERSILGSASKRTNVSREEVEVFMLELERWSMELQRRCPEDWNQCSSVLIQCLTGGSQKERDGDFCV